MAIKKTLQKVGEWVEDVGKIVTGEIKAAYQKGLLRDTRGVNLSGARPPMGFTPPPDTRSITQK